MARLLSSEVQDGDTITADQINRLVEDLWRIHQHDPDHGDGGQISHSDAADNEGEHAMINKHVQGSGTSSDPDNPGGTNGVHGLPSGRYVLGVGPEQFEIRWGTETTDRFDDDTYEQRGKADIGYPRFVETVYFAIVEPKDCAAAITTWYKATQNSVSFKVRIPGITSQMDVTVFWLVLGKVQ